MSGSPGALPPLEAVGASRDTERDLEQLFDSLRQAVARRDAILRGVAVAAGRLLGQGRWEDHLARSWPSSARR